MGTQPDVTTNADMCAVGPIVAYAVKDIVAIVTAVFVEEFVPGDAAVVAIGEEDALVAADAMFVGTEPNVITAGPGDMFAVGLLDAHAVAEFVGTIGVTTPTYVATEEAEDVFVAVIVAVIVPGFVVGLVATPDAADTECADGQLIEESELADVTDIAVGWVMEPHAATTDIVAGLLYQGAATDGQHTVSVIAAG